MGFKRGTKSHKMGLVERECGVVTVVGKGGWGWAAVLMTTQCFASISGLPDHPPCVDHTESHKKICCLCRAGFHTWLVKNSSSPADGGRQLPRGDDGQVERVQGHLRAAGGHKEGTRCDCHTGVCLLLLVLQGCFSMCFDAHMHLERYRSRIRNLQSIAHSRLA